MLEVKTPTGDVALAVHDSVLAGEDLNLLPSSDTTFFGTTLAHGRILAETGSVTASAGDNFNLPTGASIEAASQVTIRGGQMSDAPDDPDPVGSILTLAGTVQGSAVEIYGGSNLDYFDLINPNGIDAATTLTGNAGDDRFFIPVVPEDMIVNGGDGANRYYISSNAARSLFVSNGVYDDSGDDLAFPFSAPRLSSGTLTGIAANLTINTGDGGNGGSRDAIYLSTAGSSAALTDGVVTDSQVTGLGMTGSIDYTTTANGGVSLLLKLGEYNDQLQVDGAGANTQVFVFGGNGNDTVNVGTANTDLSAISGIVAFFGEGGSGDTLNVNGIATPPASGEVNPNQLTAIALTGLGSGTNRLVATHNDLFGAGYTIKNIDLVSSSLQAAQLTLDKITAFAGQLQAPTRNIDTYLANSLSAVTRNALFGYQPGDEVVYRVNTTPVAGLTDDSVYYVSEVDSTSVTLVASLDDLGNAIAVPLSSIGETKQVTLAHFDSENRVVINVTPTIDFAGNEIITDNKIVFAGNHNLTTGQAVVYRIVSGNAPIGGLTEGQVYYVIDVDATSIRLAASLANAQSDIPVPLLSPSDGTPDTLSPLAAVSFDPLSSVQNNQITFVGNHELVDLQEVVYQAGNGNDPISPLTEGQHVWVITVNATTIQLASSLEDAQSKTFITLDPIGSTGLQHSLTPAPTAASFDPSSLHVQNDQISFATDHNLTDGQQVIYHTGNGNAPIGGLIDGQRYYVEYVDARTIRLNILVTDGAVTGAADNGGGLIRIETASTANLATGEQVSIAGVTGTTEANGTWTITVVDPTHFDLQGSTFANAYSAGGTVFTKAVIHLDSQMTAALLPVVTTPLSTLLAQDLNQLIDGPLVYDAQRFAGVALRPETSQLVSQYPQGNPVLNRLLLEDAYPLGLPRIASLSPELPAAVYYAQRFINRNGDQTVTSTVENVNVHLTDLVVTGAADNGSGLIRITVASSADLEDGVQVSIAGVTGTTEANGTWTINKVDATHFDLQGSTFTNTYSTGGTVLTALQVDSTFGGNTSVDGGTNTTITLGSSLSGLHPAAPQRVGFINGTVSLAAANIVLDDSGNDQRTTGTLESDRVTGLMPGTVTFSGTLSTTIKLGANDDTFYVPATAAGQSVRLETGGGYDSVYVGTRAGAETTGTLAELQGSLFIDGGALLSGVNRLFLNDQDTIAPQTYTVTNDYDWNLNTNDANTIDTTTITRAEMVIVQYSREETVALSGGSGGNEIDIQSTHREQSTDGSTSSTFTVNTGSGGDSITLGAPVGTGGPFSMDGFQQDVVAPNFVTVDGLPPSRRGIPVLINSQGGHDTVEIRDTASTTPTSLAFTQTQFRDLFPADPDAAFDSANVFFAVFGEDPLDRPFTTVVLAQDEQRPVNISIRESLDQALRLSGQNLQLEVSLGSVNNSAASFTPSSSSVQNNQIIFAASPNLTEGQAVTYHKGDDNGSFGLDDGQIYYVKLTGNPNAIQLALTPGGSVISLSTPASGSAEDRLLPVGNVVQLTSAAYESDIIVNAGDGNDAFNIENGVRMTNGHTLQLNGGGGDDTTYVDFNGVSVIDRGNLAQTVTNVTFSRDDVDSGLPGHSPLLPGTYYVETQWSGSQWQFRLVDSAGVPVAVADLGDATGLLADWQNISALPVVGTPDAEHKHPLVSRFDTHRGFVIDFSGQYLPTGNTIVGAVRLELTDDSVGQVNGLTVAKRGILAQTVTDVTFSADDVTTGHGLTPGTYYVETQWDAATDWQFRVVDGESGNAAELANLGGTGFTADWQNIRDVTSAVGRTPCV